MCNSISTVCIGVHCTAAAGSIAVVIMLMLNCGNYTQHCCEQVTIREGQNGEVNVHGAIEEVVQSAEEMLMLLERGSMHRTTGSTLMNAASSRRYV
jgi:Kinesin motor domain